MLSIYTKGGTPDLLLTDPRNRVCVEGNRGVHSEPGEGQFSVPCYKRARNREQRSKLRGRGHQLFWGSTLSGYFKRSPPPRVMKIKTKMNKWELIKHKSFCTVKETINKMKDNPQNGRK